VLGREGKLDEAEARAREALDLSGKLPGAGGASQAAMIGPVGVLVSILLAQHKDREAEQLLADLLKSTPEGGPQRVGLLGVRSSFFARCRRWDEALADLGKVGELEPSDEDAPFQSAVLLLERGDRENYRARCQKLVASFRDANAPGPLGKTAEACLLGAETRADSEPAAQLADQALTLGKNSYRLHDLEMIKGLAEYRMGQFEKAIDWVGKSIGQPTMVMGPRPDAAAYLVMAMAQHRLGRPEEARASLAKGADIVNTKLLKRENATLDENWIDWIIADILLREARALIGSSPATNKE
jgi:tetratricopeptide (TPR) repeat protein